MDEQPTSMTLPRRRDNQTWVLDYLVKATGRTVNFEQDGRAYPAEVKNARMIPRAMEKVGNRLETLARAAEEAGHTATALELYWHGAQAFHDGQHQIFEDDHPVKIRLHDRLDACYDGVIRCAPSPIERIEVPWEGATISVLMHLLPDRRRAPTVLYYPGMDGCKERFPEPFHNPVLGRGMHLLAIDGPGQGVSNLRKLRVTDDNYERAGSAVLDYLETRPEVDAERIGIFGSSFGSLWGYRTAARDPRVKACAAVAACYGDKRYIFEEAPIRFKQIFMYMAGMQDEATFDRLAARMTLQGYGPRITCASLVTGGEYDPLCPIWETEAFYEEIAGPKELWVLENEAHGAGNIRALGGMALHPFVLDWLRDALVGGLPAGHDRRVTVSPASLAPFGDRASAR